MARDSIAQSDYEGKQYHEESDELLARARSLSGPVKTTMYDSSGVENQGASGVENDYAPQYPANAKENAGAWALFDRKRAGK
jgi:hypothetical protein